MRPRRSKIKQESTGHSNALLDDGFPPSMSLMRSIGSSSKKYSMIREKRMRTLIYKRKHSGDPDPNTGIFGNNDCMKTVRGWPFDAVIGVGGIGREAQDNCIARKITWVEIGAHKTDDPHPLVTFEHFLYYGEKGPRLEKVAPALAKRIYDGGVRLIWDTSLSDEKREEVGKILGRAKKKPPSRQLKGAGQRSVRKSNGECRPISCCGA